MRRIALSLALLLAFAPTTIAQTAAQPATTETASAADVDALLTAMDMKTLMAGMMQQMQGSQEKMLTEAFGSDMGEADRKRMQEAMSATSTIVNKHMAWDKLEPIVRKVYMQVFTRREVLAMTAFYASPEGASILKKSPQAMALTMMELQPVMIKAMDEVKAEIEKRTSAGKAAAKP